MMDISAMVYAQYDKAIQLKFIFKAVYLYSLGSSHTRSFIGLYQQQWWHVAYTVKYVSNNKAIRP